MTPTLLDEKTLDRLFATVRGCVSQIRGSTSTRDLEKCLNTLTLLSGYIARRNYAADPMDPILRYYFGLLMKSLESDIALIGQATRVVACPKDLRDPESSCDETIDGSLDCSKSDDSLKAENPLAGAPIDSPITGKARGGGCPAWRIFFWGGLGVVVLVAGGAVARTLFCW